MKFKKVHTNTIEEVAKKIETETPAATIEHPVINAEEEKKEEVPAGENWRGDARYFQSGKKAGQLKPTAKKASEANPVTPVNQVASSPVNIDDEMKRLREEHNVAASGGTQTITVDQSTKVDQKQTAWLNGYLLLIICDVFFPMAISFLFKKTLAENGKTRKHLKLSETDKKEMMPLADAAAKELALNMNATTTFFLAMSFMYASKIDE